MVLPEMKVSLQMFNYLKRIPEEEASKLSRTSLNMAFTVALMKYTSAMFCEIANILIIC